MIETHEPAGTVLPRPRLAEWILLLASTMTVMAGATIAPALPQMTLVFAGIPHADFLVRLILTLPALLIALGAPLAGWTIDRFGRKRLLLVSLFLYGFSGSSALFLPDLYAILAGRAWLGLAVAGIMGTCSTLVADYFTGEQRNRVMGRQGAFMALGGVVYITLGGWLADIDWRMPFLLYLVAWLLIWPVARFLPEPGRATHGPAGPAPAAPYPKGLIILIYATSFLGMLVFYIVPVQIPFLLKQLGPVSNTQVGLAIAASMLVGAVMGLNYARVRTRFSPTAIYAWIFGAMGVGFWVIGSAPSYGFVVAGLVCNGLGMGFLMPNTSLWLMSLAPLALRGRILGGLSSCFFLGQFLSPFLAQLVTTAQDIGSTFHSASLLLLSMAGFFLIFSWGRVADSPA